MHISCVLNWNDMSRQWVIANDQPGPDKINYGKVSRKKVAVLLDFVQITSTPHPLIWTTCTTFFERQCAKKFGQGSPPPSPSPNWPNIYSLWKVDKKFGQGPPPPQLDKIQKNSYFFRETFPKRTLGANNFISSNILCKIFEPLNHHACNSIPNILGSSILNPFRCLKMSNGEFYDFWQLKKSNGDRTKV